MLEEIKPTNGHMNLMISTNEVENILRPILEFNGKYSVRAIKLIGKYSYELNPTARDIEFCKMTEGALQRLLNAQQGFYALVSSTPGITKDHKFRVEITKVDSVWEIAI